MVELKTMAKRPIKPDDSVFRLMREIFSGSKSEADKKAEAILRKAYPTGEMPKTLRRSKEEKVPIGDLDRF